MKKAGVVIDAWKLPIFKKHLDAAGYTFTQKEGPTAKCLTLIVMYEWVAALKPVIEAANAECARTKRP